MVGLGHLSVTVKGKAIIAKPEDLFDEVRSRLQQSRTV